MSGFHFYFFPFFSDRLSLSFGLRHNLLDDDDASWVGRRAVRIAP